MGGTEYSEYRVDASAGFRYAVLYPVVCQSANPFMGLSLFSPATSGLRCESGIAEISARRGRVVGCLCLHSDAIAAQGSLFSTAVTSLHGTAADTGCGLRNSDYYIRCLCCSKNC